MKNKSLPLSYILNHHGEKRSDYFNAVSPPIIQTSNFVFDSFDAFRDAISNERHRHIYTRGNNPTVQILRKKIAALEKTEDALAFASGSGAIAAAILSFLKTGDHVICVRNPYSWTYALITEVLVNFGIDHDFVDGRKNEEIRAAIRPNTRMLILESPNTATFELQDLKACADIARENDLISVIDNSYCSPIFQNPADHGIDIIMHSGTKYLNGHSDVVCGFVCGSQAHMDRIFHFATMTLGNILSPNDAALVLRGLRTLDLRVKRSFTSCSKIVDFLKNHPKIEKILYPWDADFPQKDLAIKQMRGSGGLFSILLKTESRQDVEVFCSALKTFLFAVSWGGHESLVLPFASLKGIPNHTDPDVPDNLIRFYIGLEDPDYLIDDLRQALTLV